MSFPITSEINEVDVFSMIAKPMPFKAESGYTSHLVDGSVVKKNRGVDVIAITRIATSMGRNLFLNFWVIFYIRKIENNMDKRYCDNGTSASSSGVGSDPSSDSSSLRHPVFVSKITLSPKP